MHRIRNVLTKRARKKFLRRPRHMAVCQACSHSAERDSIGLVRSNHPRGTRLAFPSGTPQEVHHLRSAELRQLPSTLLILLHNPV